MFRHFKWIWYMNYISIKQLQKKEEKTKGGRGCKYRNDRSINLSLLLVRFLLFLPQWLITTKQTRELYNIIILNQSNE